MKKAERIETKGMVVREVVEPEVGGRGGLPYTPGELTHAWNIAIRGMQNVVAFGAMLCEVDAGISRERIRCEDGRLAGQNEGLKSWLEENCPEINYKTAMKFRRLAEITLAAARTEYGAAIEPGETASLLGLLPPKNGTFSAEEEAKKQILARFLDGKSQRDVLQLWSEGGSRPGRVAGTSKALAAPRRKDDAEILAAKRAEAAQTLMTARNCLRALTTDLGGHLNPASARGLLTDIRNDLKVIAAAIEQ